MVIGIVEQDCDSPSGRFQGVILIGTILGTVHTVALTVTLWLGFAWCVAWVGQPVLFCCSVDTPATSVAGCHGPMEMEGLRQGVPGDRGTVRG